LASAFFAGLLAGLVCSAEATVIIDTIATRANSVVETLDILLSLEDGWLWAASLLATQAKDGTATVQVPCKWPHNTRFLVICQSHSLD
jgi:hypothetical protein